MTFGLTLFRAELRAAVGEAQAAERDVPGRGPPRRSPVAPPRGPAQLQAGVRALTPELMR